MSDEVEVTIRLSSEEVRYLREEWTRIPVPGVHQADKFTDKLLAALPKPRIHPQPGDALRRKSDGRIGTWTVDNRGIAGLRWENDGFHGGLDSADPAEWEILTKAEIDELFDRKRAQS